MPRESGYPSSWTTFCSYAGKTGAEFFGFAKPLPEVNRFAARFRAASSFRSIELEGYSEATSGGYSALCRVLFVYSAFEAFLKVIGESQASIGSKLADHGAVPLLRHLRSIDTENHFYAFIHDRVNPVHQQELQNYFNDDPCNVTYLASAIRHIFAHGWLTPNAGRGEANLASDICNSICDFLLSYMDKRFSEHVTRGLDEIYGN